MKCHNYETCKGYLPERCSQSGAEAKSSYCRECQEAERLVQDKRTLDRLERKPRRTADVWGWTRGKRKP